MTIQQLKYIVALDEERHFARAAEVCLITQPGLTIQLKNLEEEIGIKIFDRTKVPLTPTTAGIEIIRKARKILWEIDQIRDFVINEKNMLRGEVKIGVISTLSPYLIPQFIQAMKITTPDVYFIIKEAHTGQLIQDVENGTLDIALMATPTGRTSLREFPVFQEPFVAYLPENHPMAYAGFYELLPQDKPELLLLEHEYCYNAQLLDICELKTQQKTKEQFLYNISSIETLKNMVRAGLGFAIVPQLSVLHENDKSFFKPFRSPQPVREISWVVADSFSRKLLLEKMSEAIWKILPDSIKQQSNYRKIRWNDSPYFINAVKGI
jgi:LysR family hydrogen peroxide-inducible transcriptional activator